MVATLADARRLMAEGQLALSQVEANGMRIDVPYLDRMIYETGEKIKEFESDLWSDPIGQTWKKIYGEGASLGSGKQLAHLLFDVLEYPCRLRTPSGLPKTDAENLEGIDSPFVRKYLLCSKLSDARGTFLMGVKNELVDGYLHASFNLNIAKSYRSSASSPNVQNFPIRDPRMSLIIRRMFIPRASDRVLVEIDMSGAEVRVSACYHKDPTMISYIERNHDYHKDLACQCYKLEPSQVTKLVRGEAKTDFVFASFYGSWYDKIAIALWFAIEHDNLKTVDGVGLKEHLRSFGITELGQLEGTGKNRRPTPGSFMEHISKVYEDFWNVRFKQYSQWKDDWWNAYLETGMCRSLTGFVYQGVYDRNQIINYPIQGSSFHCLLWSLTRINEWLTKNKMKTLVIGQIHDSIILDVHRSELDDVLSTSYRIMTKDIKKAWDWIIVPIEVEAGICEENWHYKKDVPLKQLAA